MELCRVDPMQVDQNEFSRKSWLGKIAGLTTLLSFIRDPDPIVILSKPKKSWFFQKSFPFLFVIPGIAPSDQKGVM